MSQAIALDRLPWIRALVGAHATAFESVASLFAGNPADPAAWRDTIARVGAAATDRPSLAAVLDAQLDRRGAPPMARESVRALALPNAVAVVTGQQAGAFGGPLYTLLKAVTAIQLARDQARRHDVPVVPVFWVDAEDHDWAEVRLTTVLNGTGDPIDVTLDDPPGAGHHPVGALRFPATVSDAVDRLMASLPATEFSADVSALVRRHYRPDARVGTAFAAMLEELLGPFGLVVFEADDAAAKPFVARLFAGELGHPGRTAALARASGDAMRALGHEPQVEPAKDGVALFRIDGEGRRAIRRDADGFHIGGEAVAADALIAEASAHPERFSPNVLLRPVVQDRIFPTICYVAGPSELAYQAQLAGVYRAFGVEAPLLYSRASATIIDSAAARFFDRSHLAFESLHAQDDSALNRLLEQQLPRDLEKGLAAIGASVAGQIERLRPAVTSVDPTLSGTLDTTVERVHETLRVLHNKVVHASKRKDDTLRRQFLRTRALTFPNGHAQERTLGAVYFLNKYGPGLPQALVDRLSLDTSRHLVLTL